MTGVQTCALPIYPTAAGSPSLRNPDGSGAEQMVNDTYLVREEQAKAETQESRAGDEALMDPGSSPRRDHERRGDCGCDEPHSNDRTDAENREVERRPQRLRNRAQDQQRNRGAAGKSMDEADCE